MKGENNMRVEKIVEVKRGGKYQQTYTTTDANAVYKDLAQTLHNKYLCHYSCIRRVERVQLYSGFVKIKVYYTDDVRHTYTIEDK